MSVELKIVENPVKPITMHPKKFALWLFMVSIVMLFASLTSAYIVKRGDGNWRLFELPELFWYLSGVIIVSSVFMFIAVNAARKDNFNTLKGSLSLTFLLGIAFLIGQIYSGKSLIEDNVYFVGGNPSESFIYVLAGVHWFHLISGLIFIGVILFNVFKYKIHSKAMVRLEMCATYWHFLGALWLYLFAFLMFNHQ